MTVTVRIPDPVSLEVSQSTAHPYEEVHRALRVAVESEISLDVAREWVRQVGPDGCMSLCAHVVAYRRIDGFP